MAVGPLVGKPQMLGLLQKADHVHVEVGRLVADVHERNHEREVAILVEVALDELRPAALVRLRHLRVAVAGRSTKRTPSQEKKLMVAVLPGVCDTFASLCG